MSASEMQRLQNDGLSGRFGERLEDGFGSVAAGHLFSVFARYQPQVA